MSDESLPSIEYDGVHCSLTIRRPALGVAVVILSGSDIGEFGALPMHELQKDLTRFNAIELFIDARAVRGASIEVSAEWALWMRRFAGLADLMNVFTDRAAFDESLVAAVRHVRAA